MYNEHLQGGGGGYLAWNGTSVADTNSISRNRTYTERVVPTCKYVVAWKYTRAWIVSTTGNGDTSAIHTAAETTFHQPIQCWWTRIKKILFVIFCESILKLNGRSHHTLIISRESLTWYHLIINSHQMIRLSSCVYPLNIYIYGWSSANSMLMDTNKIVSVCNFLWKYFET